MISVCHNREGYKMNRGQEREVDPPAEIESQFVLRLPHEPAKALREALKNGVTNLKDRCTIKLENDIRYGEVRVDHWLMPAKLFDLPTIMESLKTIDNKSFYKTADICQILICKEEDDQSMDEEVTSKSKKKDPNKVDKKFLWPHGITPPAKNVRRRRFRKTLKKKYVEAPEIEKEVKRLLRVDNDAASVKWEVISEDDEHKVNKGVVVKVEKEPTAENGDVSMETINQDQQSLDIEQCIFGEAVSDSDEDETNINGLEMDETSRLSAEDSRLSDSCSLPINSGSKSLVTEFTSEMFSVSDKADTSNLLDIKDEPLEYPGYSMNQYLKPEPGLYLNEQLSKDKIYERMEQLQLQLADLRTRREQQEMEIVNIENLALRQRFQEILDNLTHELLEKEQEYQQLQEILKLAYKNM
ncbi:TBP-associated factor 7 [Carabus blaptoides fortunei]